jgi:superfamily II DNA or RNA helicase
MRRSAIYVRGAWAELRNAPEGALEACLCFAHPFPWRSRAYREKRWDGKIRLYEKGSNRFPAGLVEVVVEHLEDLEREVFVTGYEERRKFDLSRFTRDYLPQVGSFKEFWDHQYDATCELLRHKRGVIKSPTGSGKSEMFIGTAAFLWEERKWRSLVIEPTKGLMRQTYERACMYLNDWISVGMAGDGERIDGNIVIATGQTMQQWRARRTKKRGLRPADPWLRSLVREFEVLFLDECHRASSSTWFDIAMHSGAHRRYGFSGTPLKDNVLDDMKLIGATGPVVFDVEAGGLIEAGLAAKPKIVMVMSGNVSGRDIEEDVEDEIERIEAVRRREMRDKVPKKERTPPPNKYQLAYNRGIKFNEHHNRAVVRAAQWMVERGRKTLLLCRYKEHFDQLAELLEGLVANYVGVWGASDNSDREYAKDALGDGRTSLVLATGIWDEGEDIPGVNSIVLAEGVATSTNSRQRVGRGMRGDTEDVWVVDFVPTSHRMLREHAAKRADAWEGEGYDVLVWETWPKGDGEIDLPFERWDIEMEKAG